MSSHNGEGGGRRPPVTSASAWRAQATYQYAADPGVPYTFKCSGKTAMLRRPDLQPYILGGKMPAVLMEAALGGRGQVENQDAKIVADNMPPEELRKMIEFTRSAIIKAFATPRIVDDPKAEDEISFIDLSEAEIMECLEWIINGAEDVPVDAEGGAVSMADLKSVGGDGRLPGDGAGGGVDVLPDPQVPGDQGAGRGAGLGEGGGGGAAPHSGGGA